MKQNRAGNSLPLSLIVTTYNRVDALKLVLESIKRQTALPNEVIIADDGSDASTKELIDTIKHHFPCPLFHCWHEDKGFRAGQIRNLAIKKSNFDYLVMIDGDMILHPDFILNHKNIAQENYMIQGGRVLLSPSLTKKAIAETKIDFSVFSNQITNHFNAIPSSFLSFLFSKEEKTSYGARTCNIAFWKKHLILTNGFNHDIEGWGREDNELVTRILNNGVKRKNLKFGGIAFHLYHQENSRERLPLNDEILKKTINLKLKKCENGLDSIQH